MLLSFGFVPGADKNAKLFSGRLLKPTRQGQLPNAVARCVSPNPNTRHLSVALQISARKNITILVADDDDVNLTVASAILKKLGYDSQVAVDSLEASKLVSVTLVSQHPFGAVLRDLNMPDMDGIEATPLIHATHGDASPPMISRHSGGVRQRPRALRRRRHGWLPDQAIASGPVGANAGALVPTVGGRSADSQQGTTRSISWVIEKSRDRPSAAGEMDERVSVMDFNRLQELRDMDDEDMFMVRELVDVFLTKPP